MKNNTLLWLGLFIVIVLVIWVVKSQKATQNIDNSSTTNVSTTTVNQATTTQEKAASSTNWEK